MYYSISYRLTCNYYVFLYLCFILCILYYVLYGPVSAIKFIYNIETASSHTALIHYTLIDTHNGDIYSTLTKQTNKTKIHDDKEIIHPPLYCTQFNSESVWVMICVTVKSECISGFLEATVLSEF